MTSLTAATTDKADTVNASGYIRTENKPAEATPKTADPVNPTMPEAK